MSRFLPVIAVGALVVACAKSNTPEDGGPPSRDAGPGDAGRTDGGAADAGGCPPDIREGGSCTQEGLFCSNSPCTDPCSFCNSFHCTGGRWERIEAFPLPCFACGDRQCIQDEQYCDIEHSDIAGSPDVTECRDMPAACLPEPTCVCLEAEVPSDRCTGDPGQLTVEHFGG